jgi:hypothetical protein
MSGLAGALRSALRADMTVAIGDGVGAVQTVDDGSSVGATLSVVAREVSSIKLVLGWLPVSLDGFEADAFATVTALMPGWGVRDVLRMPTACFVPTRLSAIGALLANTLRPDLLITRLVEREGHLHFATEVSWQRELVDAGVPVLAIVDSAAPTASAVPPLNSGQVTVVGRSTDGPSRQPPKAPEAVHHELAESVLRHIPPYARVQYGPGQLGTALLERTRVPLMIDTGLLTDAVVDLERRGLLADTPSATYLMGGNELYDWADGRSILRGIDYTHDVSRLTHGAPFFAVNTAIEIDPLGQVNVEGIGEKIVGGIGGHPDYCVAGGSSRAGLSIIAIPSTVNGRSPLVERLSRPTSTPAYDIDLIVTESGQADLRGADWSQRQRLITELFST